MSNLVMNLFINQNRIDDVVQNHKTYYSLIIKGERKLVKVIDILGKTTTKHIKSNQILFYIYDDGSTEKIYIE